MKPGRFAFGPVSKHAGRKSISRERSSGTIKRSRGAMSVGGMVTSHHALGKVDQLSHQRFQRLDIRRKFQFVHLVIGLIRKR